jgi:hypothetical protein
MKRAILAVALAVMVAAGAAQAACKDACKAGPKSSCPKSGSCCSMTWQRPSIHDPANVWFRGGPRETLFSRMGCCHRHHRGMGACGMPSMMGPGGCREMGPGGCQGMEQQGMGAGCCKGMKRGMGMGPGGCQGMKQQGMAPGCCKGMKQGMAPGARQGTKVRARMSMPQGGCPHMKQGTEQPPQETAPAQPQEKH